MDFWYFVQGNKNAHFTTIFCCFLWFGCVGYLYTDFYVNLNIYDNFKFNIQKFNVSKCELISLERNPDFITNYEFLVSYVFY